MKAKEKGIVCAFIGYLKGLKGDEWVALMPGRALRLVGDGELTQVVASRLRLDFRLVEVLALQTPTVPPTVPGSMVLSRRCVFTWGPSAGRAAPGPCAGAWAASAPSSAGPVQPQLAGLCSCISCTSWRETRPAGG